MRLLIVSAFLALFSISAHARSVTADIYVNYTPANQKLDSAYSWSAQNVVFDLGPNCTLKYKFYTLPCNTRDIGSSSMSVGDTLVSISLEAFRLLGTVANKSGLDTSGLNYTKGRDEFFTNIRDYELSKPPVEFSIYEDYSGAMYPGKYGGSSTIDIYIK